VRRHIVQRVGPVLLDPGRRRGGGRGAREGVCRQSIGSDGGLALGKRFRGGCCRSIGGGGRRVCSRCRGLYHVGVGHFRETRERRRRTRDKRERERPSYFSRSEKSGFDVWAFFFTLDFVSLVSPRFFSNSRKHRLRFFFSGAGREGGLSRFVVTMSCWRRREVRKRREREREREPFKTRKERIQNGFLLDPSTIKKTARAPPTPPPLQSAMRPLDRRRIMTSGPPSSARPLSGARQRRAGTETKEKKKPRPRGCKRRRRRRRPPRPRRPRLPFPLSPRTPPSPPTASSTRPYSTSTPWPASPSRTST